MAGAHEPGFRRIMLVLAVCALWACGANDMTNVPAHGRERAEALVAAFASKVGSPERMLSSDNKASFGAVSFKYVAENDALLIRVYVNAALLDDAPPQEMENYRKIVTFLNDPEVGGMYERGGGYFVLDEGMKAYLLVKEIPVTKLNPTVLYSETENLEEVAAHWTTGWLGEVAMIMHEHRPKPTERVHMR